MVKQLDPRWISTESKQKEFKSLDDVFGERSIDLKIGKRLVCFGSNLARIPFLVTYGFAQLVKASARGLGAALMGKSSEIVKREFRDLSYLGTKIGKAASNMASFSSKSETFENALFWSVAMLLDKHDFTENPDNTLNLSTQHMVYGSQEKLKLGKYADPNAHGEFGSL